MLILAAVLLGVVIGWIVLSQVPSILFWPGAALIVTASLFIMQHEARKPSALQHA